ncbi:MAG: malonyl-CoA decarboxylase [Piscinibacter sp.]|uniref:malonyl-CoA decarboxylase n=1 Tax=Piscinibacter TaxID=1114981 RepID=UPI000FDF220E|nr:MULTISPECIES: malonyl-CoA decarboxylase [Piscinibacter]MCW5665716.1 malonyl-CoA decarboxylase [Piscinibacter sp.]
MLDELRSAARKVNGARHLRTLMIDCRRLLSERGEANSVAIAREVVARFKALPDDQQGSFFERLSRDFSPDPQAVLASAQAYAKEPSAANLERLTREAEPPRQELLRRINRSPGGTSSIVAMRRSLLQRVSKAPELKAVEADFLHLLSSWFNPGFLQLRRVDWNSPAQLLEQIIHHEAVHEIDGWADLRRRLQPDRRCFAFFHPQLPDEPLIFVEVALLPEMPAAIAPLIDKASEPLPASQFKVAAFYSISNCQPGLKGVSLGNFLIKRVAAELKRELPQLRTFCTLSPIPGFARWLRAGAVIEGLAKPRAERLQQARAELLAACGGELDKLANAAALRALPEPAQQALLRLGAFYLGLHAAQPDGDPVARFHLDNGARLERLNALADLSGKGVRQSFGLMVNYLYDLARVELHHEKFVHAEVAQSRLVASLL